MPTYRAKVLGAEGRELLVLCFEAFNDIEAMERGRTISQGRKVELERVERHVATIHNQKE
jgi:hypothetical protein